MVVLRLQNIDEASWCSLGTFLPPSLTTKAWEACDWIECSLPARSSQAGCPGDERVTCCWGDGCRVSAFGDCSWLSNELLALTLILDDSPGEKQNNTSHECDALNVWTCLSSMKGAKSLMEALN